MKPIYFWIGLWAALLVITIKIETNAQTDKNDHPQQMITVEKKMDIISSTIEVSEIQILFKDEYVINTSLLPENAKELFTAELKKEFEEICREYELDPYFILSIMEAESGFKPDAVNQENPDCKGLMQISEKWHTDRMEKLGVTDLFDPVGNIRVAADYIRELSDTYSDEIMVLMAYNMKLSTAKELYSNGTYSEYALKIMDRTNAYR